VRRANKQKEIGAIQPFTICKWSYEIGLLSKLLPTNYRGFYEIGHSLADADNRTLQKIILAEN